MRIVGDLLDEKGADVITISPLATVTEAVNLMAEKRIGSLIVTRDGNLCGIVTERDYTRKVVVGHRSPDSTRVADIMTAEVLTTGRDANVDECMTLMTNNRIRHLPVMDGGDIAGIISIGDLMKAIIMDQARELDALEKPGAD